MLSQPGVETVPGGAAKPEGSIYSERGARK